jgi:hypothetical protein
LRKSNMQIFGRDIRPRTALNRWGQAIKDGRMYVKRSDIPHIPQEYYGNADKASFWLGQQPGIGNALEFAVDNPYLAAGALAGGTVVNNLVGNPVGGTIDFLSMGLTNLKPDEYIKSSPQVVIPTQQVSATSSSQPILAIQPGVQPSQVQIPELNEEERAKFLKYTTNRTAQQVLTYQALQDFLNQQPGMEDYQ